MKHTGEKKNAHKIFNGKREENKNTWKTYGWMDVVKLSGS